MVPAPSPDQVYLFPREEFLRVVEPALRVILMDKGAQELFVPPSASILRQVLDRIPLLYEETDVPNTRRYVLEALERLWQEMLGQPPETPVVQPVPTPTPTPTPAPEPEPPKPVEVEAVLEPVYVEVPFYLSETEFIVARAFDRWEGKVAVNGNEYTVRLYQSERHPGVYVLEVERFVEWYTWRWHAYYHGLPENGTRVSLSLDGRLVALTVYYRLVEPPNLGVVEVAEEHMTLWHEDTAVLPDGEEIAARIYVINATTFLGGPALLAQRGSSVIAVFGAVGTFEAGVSVQVYGVPTRICYTATAELVLPNGTAIPMKVEWWYANPPTSGIIYISTHTNYIPQDKRPTTFSGTTIRITIPELNLTILVRIPG